MARIVGVDLPKNKRGEIGLTYIYGIGRSTARKILDEAGISYDLKVQDWSDSSQEILASMQATAASILNKQQRRMINAFPRLRFTDSIKYSKIIETLHEMLRRK